MKAGHWPKKYNECVVVLTSSGKISDMMAYTLGLRDSSELDQMVQQFANEEDVDIMEDIKLFELVDDPIPSELNVLSGLTCL